MNTEEAPPSYEELQNYAPHQEIEKLKKQLAESEALLAKKDKMIADLWKYRPRWADECQCDSDDEIDPECECECDSDDDIDPEVENELAEDSDCEACPDGDCECECDSEPTNQDIDVVAINTEDWGIGIDTLYLDEETRIVYNPLDSQRMGEQLLSGCWIIAGRNIGKRATVWA
tara:strand:- start:1534 stop:2055 length:522 start_codon:yes stop_codon:yes gene_type:complete